MGLFAQRPEENDEWAGIPSEPLREESAAERLGAPAPVGALGLGGPVLGGSAVESIVIPVAPVVEVARPSVESSDGDAD